ncbi:uncharacterized protein [Periplaneta americana]|uniref:uncharacterized protein isoform X3 n=1 Tax=Periplaneta americana TaxID=6978 RepID=UPI0037E70436
MLKLHRSTTRYAVPTKSSLVSKNLKALEAADSELAGNGGNIGPVHWNRSSAINYLVSHQAPDGSFGDVFTTTEVVLGLGPQRLSSVRDLNCGSGNSAGTFTASVAKLQPSTATTLPPTAVASADSNLTVEGTTPRQNPKGDDLATVTYTLWVGTNVTENFTISVTAKKNSTFYHIMQIAAEQDSHYVFEATEWPNGHYVHTIAGYKEEPSCYHYWLLYQIPTLPEPASPPGNNFVTPVDTLSMVLLALNCIVRDHRNRNLDHYIKKPNVGLAEQQHPDGSFGNLHSTALAVQALEAADSELAGNGGNIGPVHWNHSSAINYLVSRQAPDDSFGDVFTTTEVVLGLGPRRLSSVRDLNCGSGNSAGTFTASVAKLHPSTATTLPPTAVASADSNLTVEGMTPRKNPKGDDLATVTYTLWVGTNVTENFTVSVTAKKNSTFYHIMQIAAEQDSHYVFEATEWPNGHYVHTIAGYKEEPSCYHYWLLYQVPTLPEPASPPGNNFVTPVGKLLRNLWPPRSPDLTTPDFFLWGYLKDRVYATRPQTLDDQKHNITQEIQAIDNRVLQRVASNMERRVELCLMQDGGHFQHLL